MGRFDPMPGADLHPVPPVNQKQIDKIRLILKREKRTWYRVYTASNDPLFYGNAGYRFDSFAGLFGTLYISAQPEGAFIETFGRTLGMKLLPQSKLNKKAIAVLKTDTLNLIDITGRGAPIAGLDGRISTDTNYDGLTRPWADALYKHKLRADGILFRARHDLDQIVAAIFDRAKDKIRIQETIGFASRKGMIFLRPIVDSYKYAIIDDTSRTRSKREIRRKQSQ